MFTCICIYIAENDLSTPPLHTADSHLLYCPLHTADSHLLCCLSFSAPWRHIVANRPLLPRRACLPGKQPRARDTILAITISCKGQRKLFTPPLHTADSHLLCCLLPGAPLKVGVRGFTLNPYARSLHTAPSYRSFTPVISSSSAPWRYLLANRPLLPRRACLPGKQPRKRARAHGESDD